MSFFVKAAVHALKKFPVLNASVDGNDIIYHGYFDIGIAVGSPRGLVVPILRDADQMSFADIEEAIADFGKRTGIACPFKHRQVPDIDGIEFLVRLRREPRLADVPVVVVSASAMPAQIAAASAVGAVDYLTKPVMLDKLLAVLDQHLAGAASNPA